MQAGTLLGQRSRLHAESQGPDFILHGQSQDQGDAREMRPGHVVFLPISPPCMTAVVPRSVTSTDLPICNHSL